MNYLLDGKESTRILFKKAHRDQFDQWLAFHQDPLSNKYWIGDYQDPKSECEKWYDYEAYRYENQLGGKNAMIDKTSGLLIGYTGLLIQTVDDIQELEIAYSLVPSFRGKGYATEAAIFCRDYAFRNSLSESLISIISKTNLPSQKVALNMGMKTRHRTIYKRNEVDIFRINKSEWLNL